MESGFGKGLLLFRDDSRERRRRRARLARFAVPCVALATLLAPRAARADDEGLPDPSGVLSGVSLGLPASSIPLRLVGHVGSPGHAGRGGRGGIFVGVDTGIALSVAAGGDPMRDAWTFGVRGGYELANGLALQLRYDDLGVKPHATVPPSSPAQIGSFGIRYSMPFLFPLPFFEAMWGPAVYGGSVSLGGGLGLGLSIPIGGFVRIDVSARDWLMEIDDRVHQILTFEGGIAVSFGSLGHRGP